MKKLVIKTVAFTIGLIVIALSITYILFATLSPSSVSDVYFRLGSENMSLKYSIRAYEKSSDIDSLATLTERAIVFKNHELTDKYGTMLINGEGYAAYSKSKGDGYGYYIVGSIAEAKYRQGYKTAAMQLALDNTESYTTVNPIRVVLSLAIESEDAQTVSLIKEGLMQRTPSDLLSSDLIVIENYLNSQGV